MAKGFDVLHIKSAVKSRNKFDLSRTHLTTMEFGQPTPLFVEETVPGDDITVNANYFSRMAPLAKPTYGKFQFKTMAAYVPYHQIADDADAWISGKTAWEGVTPVQRYITMYDLAYFLLTYCSTTAPATATTWDWSFTDASGLVHNQDWTNVGRYYVRVLNSLGYAIPESVDFQNTSTWYANVKDVKLSAYPLLAFFKAYNDYMSQSTLFNGSSLTAFLHNVKHNNATTGYSAGHLTQAGMNELFRMLYLQYENDYFISAWAYPNSPVPGTDTINAVSAPYSATGADNILSDTSNVRLVSVGSSGYSSNLSQRALDFLKSFDDWVRRNNYSGSRDVQQIYSRFGIKTDDYRSNYAHVLATDSIPVQVGDVTASAATQLNGEDVYLGDYAGKGIVNGSKSVSLKADDFGLMMIIGYYTVTPMNPYGFDRRVLRNAPLDYYNPEFDGLGADAIPVCELYCDPRAISASDSSSDVDVFGFTERYNSYRYGRDLVTGDFRSAKMPEMSTWHTARNLSGLRTSGNLLAQTFNVNAVERIDSQYNRMFSVTSSTVDHFYLTAHFNVSAVRPMLNLNQVPKLGEGNTAVSRNGNVID